MIDANKLILYARLTFDVPEPPYIAAFHRLCRALARRHALLDRPPDDVWPDVIGDEDADAD